MVDGVPGMLVKTKARARCLLQATARDLPVCGYWAVTFGTPKGSPLLRLARSALAEDGSVVFRGVSFAAEPSVLPCRGSAACAGCEEIAKPTFPKRTPEMMQERLALPTGRIFVLDDTARWARVILDIVNFARLIDPDRVPTDLSTSPGWTRG